MRRVHIVSSHLPSRMICTDDGFDLEVRQMTPLVRGARRHNIFLAVDANVHLGARQQEPALIGSGAFATTYRSFTSTTSSASSESSAASTFSNDISGMNIKLLNTFAYFWNAFLPTSTTASSSGTPSARPTWTGHAYGRPTH